jgi:hypothetical protein
MNSEKLAEITNKLYETEKKFRTQSNLEALVSQLQSLVSQPHDPSSQSALAAARSEFKKSVERMTDSFPPRDMERIGEIDTDGYFNPTFVDKVSNEIDTNAMTPEVARAEIADWATDRESFLSALETLVETLEFFNLGYSELKVGEAELGVQIPRTMFDNDLDGLRNELRDFSLIAQWFSQTVTKEKQKVTVETISTSDPLFTFSFMDVATLGAIAKTFEWALGCWEKVLNIRKLRADTESSGEFSNDEIESFYGKKIESTVNKAIDEKLEELQKQYDLNNRPELKAHMRKALEWIISKTEHGYTAELRLPPPTDFADEQKVDENEQYVQEQELRRVQRQLVFPSFEGTTILEIPDLSEEIDND